MDKKEEAVAAPVDDKQKEKEEEPESLGLDWLLLDTNYKRITFEWKDFKTDLFALKTASTDYDLTGQVIWQAADIMSAWFVESFMD